VSRQLVTEVLPVKGCAVGLVIVGNRVRDLRADRGLSQAQLAEAMGVSRQTINSIETCRYLPSLPLALALAGYFQSTVEEVFHVEKR
jgi:putative transcriptional regulator